MRKQPDIERIEAAEEVVHGMGLRRFARRDYAKVRSYLDVLEDLEAKVGRMMLEDGGDEDDGADDKPEQADAADDDAHARRGGRRGGGGPPRRGGRGPPR